MAVDGRSTTAMFTLWLRIFFRQGIYYNTKNNRRYCSSRKGKVSLLGPARMLLAWIRLTTRKASGKAHAFHLQLKVSF